MKQLFCILFSLLTISSFAQVLRSNGSMLILVDSTNLEQRLTDEEFKECVCTEYTNGYEVKNNPRKVYYPKFNDQNEIVVKNQDDEWMLISSDGRQLHTFSIQSWSSPNYYEPGRYSINRDDTTFIFTLDHALVKKAKVDMYMAYGDAHLSANDQGKYALLDVDGNVRMPYDYTCTSWDAKNFRFSTNGLVCLKNSSGKCGIVNFMGDTILPFIYDYIDDLHPGQNDIKRDGLWGTIDPFGKIVVPIMYEEIPYGFYYSKYNIVKKDGKWMITDSILVPISEKRYDEVREVKMGVRGWHIGKYRVYSENGKVGLLCASGESVDILTEPIYDSITDLDTFYLAHGPSEIAVFEENGRLNRRLSRSSYSFSDDFGNEIVSSNEKRRILVIQNGLKGIESLTGESIIACKFDQIEYKGNHFIVKVKGKVGLVDWDGNNIIEPIYDRMDLERYMDNSYQYQVLIEVENNGKVGVINDQSEVIIPMDYDEIQWVNLDETPIYMALKKKKHGLLDSKNQIIIPFKYTGSCTTDKRYISITDHSCYCHSLIFYDSKNAAQFLMDGKIIETKERKKGDDPCVLFD